MRSTFASDVNDSGTDSTSEAAVEPTGLAARGEAAALEAAEPSETRSSGRMGTARSLSPGVSGGTMGVIASLARRPCPQRGAYAPEPAEPGGSIGMPGIFAWKDCCAPDDFGARAESGRSSSPGAALAIVGVGAALWLPPLDGAALWLHSRRSRRSSSAIHDR